MRALVTGGAGFIGGHLVDALVEAGHEVRVLDNLEPSVHGEEPPTYLNPKAEYRWEDVRNAKAVREAAQGVEVLFHLASLIDVPESQREPGRYADANVRGTAVLLDALERDGSLERMVLASSVAVYGEGAYRCPHCGDVAPQPRPGEQLQAERWEVRCPQCGREVEAQATPETHPPSPLSMYGVTKWTQERLVAARAEALETPAVLLRYANAYGPRQRAGPYAGVITTFLQRLRKGDPLVVHEDGKQTRDYIYVADLVAATLRAAETDVEGVLLANVGTGTPTTVSQVAATLQGLLDADGEPVEEGTFREGDIRHLWVDSRRAREKLGFTASITLQAGLENLLQTEG